MLGQMHEVERGLIFETVRQCRPQMAVECGTWYGGGSTYFAALALAINGKGHLHTVEIDAERRKSAIESFQSESPGLLRHLEFWHGDFIECLGQMFPREIQYATLDGPEDADYTLASFQAVDRRMKSGGIVIFHDWKIHKCEKVKKWLSESDLWTIPTVLDTETGMALATKTA